MFSNTGTQHVFRHVKNLRFPDVFVRRNVHCCTNTSLLQRNVCEFTASLERRVSTSFVAASKCNKSPQVGNPVERPQLNTTNIDMDDVLFHEAVANWWSESSKLRLLHLMNDVRVPFVYNGLKDNGVIQSTENVPGPDSLKGIRIVEVGCGAGIMSEALAMIGAEVTGLDASALLTKVASQHGIENAHQMISVPTYICCNIEDYAPKNPHKFDAIVLTEIIEHIIDKERFLKSCLKVVKPGGSIFLTTPNRTYLSWFCNIILAENVLRLVPRGIHSWSSFITPDELQEMLSRLGCKTISTKGIVFNIFKKKWVRTENNVLHYVMHTVKNQT